VGRELVALTDAIVALALVVVFVGAARFWEIGQDVLERKDCE
jgi:hypothetical protein